MITVANNCHHRDPRTSLLPLREKKVGKDRGAQKNARRARREEGRTEERKTGKKGRRGKKGKEPCLLGELLVDLEIERQLRVVPRKHSDSNAAGEPAPPLSESARRSLVHRTSRDALVAAQRGGVASAPEK